MSINEIAGTKKATLDVYNRPLKTTQSVSPAYTKAVNQVRNAPKGTLISRGAVITVDPVVPQIVPNLISNPAGTVIGGLWDFWTGSPADKLKQASLFIPAVQTTESYDIARGNIITEKTFQEIINDVIKKGSETPEGKKFWDTHTLGPTDIEIPEIKLPGFPDLFGWVGDLGKYALIGIAGLVAIILLTRKK